MFFDSSMVLLSRFFVRENYFSQFASTMTEPIVPYNSPIKSQLVNSCLDTLSVAVLRKDITIIWVPAHRNIEGNEKADELAKIGTTLDLDRTEQVKVPLFEIKRELYISSQRFGNSRWRNL